MKTTDIPRPRWQTFLDEFSRIHLGQRVRLWAAGPTHGLLREAVDLPLVGVCADRSAHGCDRIDVIVGDSPAAHVTRAVRCPCGVRVSTDDGGEDMALQIDSEDGSSTFLDLRQPAAKTTPAAFA